MPQACFLLFAYFSSESYDLLVCLVAFMGVLICRIGKVSEVFDVKFSLPADHFVFDVFGDRHCGPVGKILIAGRII